MSISNPEKFNPYIFNLKESPCQNCIVRSTCTKSFIDKTACEKYERFLWSIIEKEQKRIDDIQN